MQDSNIPVDHQSRLDQEYSEEPVYCTECGKQCTDYIEIDNEAHHGCMDLLMQYSTIKTRL